MGIHPLRHGMAAVGVALPFGHADAAMLGRLVDAAGSAGAAGFRTAPGRVLLVIGIETMRIEMLTQACSALGFITDPADPRRHLAACAGAPTCAAGEMPARAIAPEIAAAAVPLLDGSLTLHLSGCSKGCAHRGAAGLTIVGEKGRYGLVLAGDARGAPLAQVSAPRLPESLANLVRAMERARRPHERAADTLARLGAELIAEAAHE